jgi:4'-phosphopantetheinyl transferase
MQHGKPEVADRTGHELQFNLSHSHDLAVYAITRRRRIGVDIERVREMAVNAMAHLVFSPDEQETLSALPRSEAIQTFLAGWTRKEAYVKARGEGFAIPFNSFEVSMVPNAPPALLRNLHAPADVDRWVLRHVDPAAGYIGALAVEGDGWRLMTSQWPPRSRSVC